MQPSLDTQDIRALLRLLAELRELGGEPEAWRSHLARRLEQLCGAPVSLVIELRRNEVTPAFDDKPSCADFVTPLHAVTHGLDTSAQARFYRELYFTDHSTDDALGGIVPLYGTAFTVRRADVISDRNWNRSVSANERWRPNGLDDFIMSMVPVPELNVLSSMEVYRGPGRRFAERERLFLALLHEELANDWKSSFPRAGVRLTPRQEQVLARLNQGASEKRRSRTSSVCRRTRRTTTSKHCIESLARAVAESCWRVHEHPSSLARSWWRQATRAHARVDRVCAARFAGACKRAHRHTSSQACHANAQWRARSLRAVGSSALLPAVTGFGLRLWA